VEDAYLSWADYLRYKDMVEAEVGRLGAMAELRAAKDAAELAAIRRARPSPTRCSQRFSPSSAPV
jgi:Xaa-Pro aminopeptidase